MIVVPSEGSRLDFHPDLSILVQTSDQLLTAQTGLLLFRQFDHQIGLTQRIADVLHDPRSPHQITYSFHQLLSARLFAILAGLVDQNDQDTLRTDPVFKMMANLSPGAQDTAAQPTFSRFENQIDAASLLRIREVLVDTYLDSFCEPPRSLLFDLDGVDDPVHGKQHLAFYHGYFRQHQYFPLILTCAATDQVVMASLRHGTAHVSLGVDSDLEFLVARIRQRWPDVHISIRADAGFGVPRVYELCERLGLTYTLGLAGNAALHRQSEELLAQAQAQYQQTHQPQRLFRSFWYRAGSWDRSRCVVVKCEANSCGINRRYVVTNRLGALHWPGACYDAYAQRGESENRNKELKCDLQMDRLSDHRFRANAFRLSLHVAAYNLLVRLRQEVGDPPLRVEESLPLESASSEARKSYQNRCRREDPLGEGHPETWRRLLINVAAVVLIHRGRVIVQISSRWPYHRWWQQVAAHLAVRPTVPHYWSG